MRAYTYIKQAIFLLAFCLLFSGLLYSQSIFFNHLSTSNGLSDNNVKSMAVDKNGFLWIGTADGVNVYDGYKVRSISKKQEVALASNNITAVFCDSANRIWICTPEGATWLDDKRKLHRVLLEDSIENFACRSMQQTASFGNILFTNRGQFHFDSSQQQWSRIAWIPPGLRYDKTMDIASFDTDQVLFTMDSVVVLLDYKTRKIIYQDSFFPLLSACRMNAQQIAVGLQTGRVKIIDIFTGNTKQEYWLTSPFRNKRLNTNLTNIQCAANGDLLVSTGFAGLVVITKMGNIIRHLHDPLNPRSISANNTSRVLTEPNGNVFVATNTSGLNIGNIYTQQAGYKSIFSNASGELFDNYLNEMVEDKDGSFWIGAYDRLIHWDKKTDKAAYYYYYMQTPLQGLRTVEIRSLCFDKKDRLWVSAVGGGIAILNKTTSELRKVPHDTSLGPALRSHFVHDLLSASDNMIWACSNTGIFKINPVNLQVTTFDHDTLLKQVASRRTVALFEDNKQHIWFSVPGEGLYRYAPKERTLQQVSTRDGLVSNTCYAFRQDRSGNLYVASPNGFSMISREGKIKSYTTRDGLRYDRCEGFMEDNTGHIWIANNKCLVKFNPASGGMEYFDQNAGISVSGFRADCYAKSSSGEMIWGGHQGLNYFFPGELSNNPAQIKLSISSIIFPDSISVISENARFNLSYANSHVQFHFAAVNLLGSRQIEYRYKLEGFDKEWQSGVDITESRYASLLPGQYTFKVKASIDRINWIDSNNEVQVNIVPPLWLRWWFILGVSLLLGLTAYTLVSWRSRRKTLQQEELETQKAINYFASSMYQRQSVEMILWDVAKNCIGRLQFEDAVIYLLDAERQQLIQMAAHGPKNPHSFEITNPIIIPVGKGIVGAVAASGKTEIIADTSADPRYIIDEQQRFSEIAVPIISDGVVLGVIDCEHSTKNYFTTKHQQTLTTIASLCANKIVRARAEEEKILAEETLMNTQQKMAEVEMQALRAQMNPHFIFNCLNSINRYIVKSDQATASLYLTRFAKLIRLILDNSNTKNVILSNELEALRLYIEMESLRFEKKFTYQVTVDPNVNPDSLEVPPLIIQPYVENAIWHGLLHKESGGHLAIRVRMLNEAMLECVIEDDGVGRKKAMLLKSKSATTRKSLGMQLTESRIALLNKHAALNASIEIIDLEAPGSNPGGTRVILKIPV